MVYVDSSNKDEGDLLTGSRVCKECGERKSMTEFFFANGKKHRRRKCKSCCVLASKEIRHANPERSRAYGYKYKLKVAYGLTVEQFESMLLGQGGKCKICSRSFSQDIRLVPHVDHDHETGVVRGVLCFTCNTALGKFNDDVELLKAAIKYLGG